MPDPVTGKRPLALTLCYLFSIASIEQLQNLFGVSRSFVCQCVREVSRVIIKRFPEPTTFPKRDDLLNVLQDYEEKWGFPKCAGAIDGTHVLIIAPADSNIEYVNRKGCHSIVMQAVTDCNYMFRDVVIGWPGSFQL